MYSKILFLAVTFLVGCGSFQAVKTANPQVEIDEIVAAGNNQDAELTSELTSGLAKLLDKRIENPNTLGSEKTIESIIALQKLSPPQGKTQFVKLLQDEDEDIRYHSVDALGDVRSSEVIEALITAVEDEDDLVADAASRSLSKLTLTPIHQEFEPNAEKWKEWWQLNKKYFLSK